MWLIAVHSNSSNAAATYEEEEKGNNLGGAGLGGTTGKGMVFAVALSLGVAALGVPGAHEDPALQAQRPLLGGAPTAGAGGRH